MALLMAAGAVISERVSHRLGAYRVVAVAMLLMAGGIASVSLLGADAGFWSLMPSFAVIGIGGGLTVPLTASVLDAMPRGEAGVASGIFNASREVSGLLGHHRHRCGADRAAVDPADRRRRRRPTPSSAGTRPVCCWPPAWSRSAVSPRSSACAGPAVRRAVPEARAAAGGSGQRLSSADHRGELVGQITGHDDLVDSGTLPCGRTRVGHRGDIAGEHADGAGLRKEAGVETATAEPVGQPAGDTGQLQAEPERPEATAAGGRQRSGAPPASRSVVAPARSGRPIRPRRTASAGRPAATITAGAGRTFSRTAAITCCTWPIRSPADPHGTPRRSASRSASGRPLPIPSSNRPSDSCCRADASRTTAAGCRNGAAITQVRNRSFDVQAAAAASAGNGDAVHSVSGISRLVQPCCSADRASSTHSRPPARGVTTSPNESSLFAMRVMVPAAVRRPVRAIPSSDPESPDCGTSVHQPRARHSPICGRSSPSVVSSPCPG